jgi:hypothetical protein
VSLAVLVDGAPMAKDDAREFWKRFSAWMEEHPGDLAGFARAEGYESVHPQLHGGEPILVASRTAGQAAYAPAPRTPAASPAKAGGGKSRRKRR